MSTSPTSPLSTFPTLLWTNSNDSILLKINIHQAKDTILQFTSTHLYFKGCSSDYKNIVYEFNIKLYDRIDELKSTYVIKSNYIDVKLLKIKKVEWKYLTLEGSKNKIVVDWDRANEVELELESEDVGKNEDDLEFKRKEFEKSQVRIKKLEELIDKNNKSLISNLVKGDLKTIYLLCYNSFFAVIWTLICGLLIIGSFYHGYNEYVLRFYNEVSPYLKLIQLLSILEVVNSALGLVKSNVLGALGFYIGRNVVLFLVIDGLELDMFRQSYFTLLIFFGWSLCESIRNIFNTLKTFELASNGLKYLRYTVPFVFFPFVSGFEAYVEFLALFRPELENFNYSMPNSFNFAFDTQLVLMGVLVIHIAASFMMFQFLSKQRLKQINSNDNEEIVNIKKKN